VKIGQLFFGKTYIFTGIASKRYMSCLASIAYNTKQPIDNLIGRKNNLIGKVK
jgi:hypothetical protein